MPGQEEHEKPENLVEASQQEEIDSARSLGQAADSHSTLDGYYAMNNRRPQQAEPSEGKPEDQEK